jgi:hypothetical protein
MIDAGPRGVYRAPDGILGDRANVRGRLLAAHRDGKDRNRDAETRGKAQADVMTGSPARVAARGNNSRTL